MKYNLIFSGMIGRLKIVKQRISLIKILGAESEIEFQNVQLLLNWFVLQ
jgi:hypothetical protein